MLSLKLISILTGGNTRDLLKGLEEIRIAGIVQGFLHLCDGLSLSQELLGSADLLQREIMPKRNMHMALE